MIIPYTDYKYFTANPERPSIASYVLVFLSVMIVVLTLPLSLFFCVKVAQEYERAVIFRLGRLWGGGAKVAGELNQYQTRPEHVQGPGIFFLLPCVDSYQCVDLRTVSFDVPPQEVSPEHSQNLLKY